VHNESTEIFQLTDECIELTYMHNILKRIKYAIEGNSYVGKKRISVVIIVFYFRSFAVSVNVLDLEIYSK
jgi:hypothetical protein